MKTRSVPAIVGMIPSNTLRCDSSSLKPRYMKSRRYPPVCEAPVAYTRRIPVPSGFALPESSRAA